MFLISLVLLNCSESLNLENKNCIEFSTFKIADYRLFASRTSGNIVVNCILLLSNL